MNEKQKAAEFQRRRSMKNVYEWPLPGLDYRKYTILLMHPSRGEIGAMTEISDGAGKVVQTLYDLPILAR